MPLLHLVLDVLLLTSFYLDRRIKEFSCWLFQQRHIKDLFDWVVFLYITQFLQFAHCDIAYLIEIPPFSKIHYRYALFNYSQRMASSC